MVHKPKELVQDIETLASPYSTRLCVTDVCLIADSAGFSKNNTGHQTVETICPSR
ncbi:MAG TPA: hypothetical protein VHR42_03380 [Clostridia bacterium]|nr:hypothetical protein [Clostridia bacterium]